MPTIEPALIVALVVVLLAVIVLIKAVRIVPQARARNVERLGRYHRTLNPGLNFVIPFVDRVYPAIDLREQVVSFRPQPVITEDNLVVEIDTVLYFQVTDPRSAAYEIASYLQAVEQLTGHHPAQRGRVDGPGEDAHLPRQDQQPAARRARRGHRASGGCGSTGWRSRPSTRRRASRTRWRSRCAPSGTSAPRSCRPRAQPEPDPHRRGRQAGRHPARRGGAHRRHPAGRGPEPAPSTRSSRRCTATTPTRRCSPTSTCRCCPSSPTARATRSG